MLKLLLSLVMLALCDCTSATNQSHTMCDSDRDKLVVDCGSRGLTSVPKHIDNDTEQLYLDNNLITSLTSKAFVYLVELKVLSLSNNVISWIHREAFYGLPKLVNLNLENNLIDKTSIPSGAFVFLLSLQTLNVRGNRYWTYHMDEESEISTLVSLENLTMGVVDTIKFNSEMRNLKKLKVLNIFLNKAPVVSVYSQYAYLLAVRNKSFEAFTNSNIETISLNASQFENDALCPLTNLQTIYLDVLTTEEDISISVFRIFHCFRKKKMKRIEIKGISYKNAFVLNGHNLKYLTGICLKELVLANNNIRDISGRYFGVFAERSSCLELLDLSNNPLYGFAPWIIQLIRFPNIKVIKLSSIGMFDVDEVCHDPQKVHTNLFFVVSNSLEEVYVTKTRTNVVLPNLHLTGGKSLRIANFSNLPICWCNGSIYGFPEMNSLDISGWRCYLLNPRIIGNFPKLETFVAKNSHLGAGFQKNKDNRIFFQNNKLLKRIDLSNNDLSYLPFDFFSKQRSSLTHLILQNNSIRNIPIYINEFSELSVLDLSLNKITEIKKDDQDRLKTKRNIQIRLKGNPFHCMCQNLQFLKWASESGIDDFITSMCLSETGSQIKMISILTDIESFERHCSSKFWITFVISLSSFIIVVILMTILYHRYRYTIDYLLIKIRLKIRPHKPLINEQEFQFDAFISHSHHDIGFVMPIYRTLRSRGFNISLDSKDFIPGRFISENIVDIVEKSRKIIFVISEKFLESHWGFYELEMTRMHAYREDRQNMVIVIIKDGISPRNMPRVLREMWSKITCIEWPPDISNNDEETMFNSISLALEN